LDATDPGLADLNPSCNRNNCRSDDNAGRIWLSSPYDRTIAPCSHAEINDEVLEVVDQSYALQINVPRDRVPSFQRAAGQRDELAGHAFGDLAGDRQLAIALKALDGRARVRIVDSGGFERSVSIVAERALNRHDLA
jgi:hypothetical protein